MEVIIAFADVWPIAIDTTLVKEDTVVSTTRYHQSQRQFMAKITSACVPEIKGGFLAEIFLMKLIFWIGNFSHLPVITNRKRVGNL
jgi:hypothetical protein